VRFIGRCTRIGRTLLEPVLGGLPGVCALGAVAWLWSRELPDVVRCGCDAPFSGSATGARVVTDSSKSPGDPFCLQQARSTTRRYSNRQDREVHNLARDGENWQRHDAADPDTSGRRERRA
jgi:hypothetical protein